MNHKSWKCPKCQHREYETDQFRATGGNFAKFFDVQNKRFTTVSRTRCTFTEIYRTPSSKLGNVFDFFATN
jgi:hypothetical protein